MPKGAWNFVRNNIFSNYKEWSTTEQIYGLHCKKDSARQFWYRQTRAEFCSPRAEFWSLRAEFCPKRSKFLEFFHVKNSKFWNFRAKFCPCLLVSKTDRQTRVESDSSLLEFFRVILFRCLWLSAQEKAFIFQYISQKFSAFFHCVFSDFYGGAIPVFSSFYVLAQICLPKT